MPTLQGYFRQIEIFVLINSTKKLILILIYKSVLTKFFLKYKLEFI